MKPEPMTNKIPRRQFMSGLLTGTAPLVLPARVLGLNGRTSPNSQIVLGAVGIGPRGRQVLGSMFNEEGVRFVAICDVQASRREQVKKMADDHYGNTDCAMYRTMDELYARPDIDSVLVATGDRWHALASIRAARAGKDVYAEKPCGITMGDCAELAETMRQRSRVFQAGTQRRSVGNYQFAVHLARSGKLGKLKTLHASINQLGTTREWLPEQPEPPPEVCDWNQWLGPAPWRPYNARYVNGGWRGHYDFDSGARLLDWGVHTVDLCQWANHADDTTPIAFEPEATLVRARYANGVDLVIRPEGWLGLGTCPVRFEGEEGWVETGDTGSIEAHPRSLLGERRRFVDVGTFPGQHTGNFFACVRSRARPACNQDVMEKTHMACHAAAIAWQLGRALEFDPATHSFPGDDIANRMRTRAKRAPFLA
jgi:predicted dehydrogenase